jgi:AcrR family transcriptional regulator
MSLDREMFVRTALRVLSEVGLDGLTLRKIAAELGVQAPAMYWHFKNKQELLDEMATTAFADGVREIGLPRDDQTWAEWTVEYGTGLRRALLRYRDGAKAFSGTHLTDAAMFGFMEAALHKFIDADFPVRDAMRGFMLIYYFTVGFTIEEQAVYPRPGERNKQYDLTTRAESIASAEFPLALAAGEELLARFDERFEHGLQVIITGLRP